MGQLVLQQKAAIADLTERLTNCPLITRYGPEEVGTIVHALSDLEGSLHTFLDDQLPKLADPSARGDVLEDLLLEVREEVRHILYHLRDPEFFRQLDPVNPKDDNTRI